MKKLTKAMLLGVSCALAVSLVACGNDNKSGQGNAKAPDPEKIKTEQVTSSQWTSAMDVLSLSNLSVKVSSERKIDGRTESTVSTAMIDGSKSYFVSTDQNGEQDEIYFSASYGVTYRYYKDDATNKWVKDVTERPWSIDSTVGDMIGAIADEYSRFEYNSSAAAYTANIDNYDFSVKIKDGKLSVLQYSGSEANGSGSGTYEVKYILQIYNIGSTSVTLPRVSENGGTVEPDTPVDASGYTVTARQWQSALTEKIHGNVTVTSSDSYTNETRITKLDSANKRVYFESVEYSGTNPSGTLIHGISTKVGSSDVVYIRKDNETRWTRYTSGEYVRRYGYDIQTDSTSSAFGIFSGMYSQFTYNSDTRSYVATNIRIDGTTTLSRVTVKFENGNMVMFEYVARSGSDTITQTYNMSDYGSTVVELPSSNLVTDAPTGGDRPVTPGGDIDVPSTPDDNRRPGEVSENTWYSALSEENFKNCEIMMQSLSGARAAEQIDFDNKLIHISSYDHVNGEEDYYYAYLQGEVEPSAWRVLRQTDEGYVYDGNLEGMHEFDIPYMYPMFAIALVEQYRQFRFEGDVYVANNLTLLDHIFNEVRVRFNGNQLASIELVDDDDRTAIDFLRYDRVHLTIPNFTVPEDVGF